MEKTLSDGRLQPNILDEFKGQSWIKELCRAIAIQVIKEEINYKNYLSENHKHILKHGTIKEINQLCYNNMDKSEWLNQAHEYVKTLKLKK